MGQAQADCRGGGPGLGLMPGFPLARTLALWALARTRAIKTLAAVPGSFTRGALARGAAYVTFGCLTGGHKMFREHARGRCRLSASRQT